MAQIQWYPGHMAKTNRQIEEKIGLADMVIEVRDARIPLSSANPLLDQLIGTKPRLIVLAKNDKADPAVTTRWVQTLTDEQNYAVAVDLLHDKVNSILTSASRRLNASRIKRLQSKGVKTVLIKALVCGIPNVGKSTLINQTARRRMAKTSDKPGVTRSLQWIKISDELVLLDTPGVLWPKFEDQTVGYRLALTGAVADDVLPMEEVARYALNEMIQRYPQRLMQRYQLDQQQLADCWNAIGLKRGCLVNGSSIDTSRLATLILRDLRDGCWGQISWEAPDANR